MKIEKSYIFGQNKKNIPNYFPSIFCSILWADRYYIKGTYSEMWLVVDTTDNRIWIRHSKPVDVGRPLSTSETLNFSNGVGLEEIPF